MWLCSSWGCFLIIWDEKHSTEGGRELWSASLLISGVNSNCGLISSRPPLNATSAPPEKNTLSLLWTARQMQHVSLPTGTGPHLDWLCLSQWSLSSLKGQLMHLRPPVATAKLTVYHLFSLFSPLEQRETPFPLSSEVWGGVNLLITTRGHV